MAHSDPSLLAGIPTLDIRAFINGDKDEKAAFAAALGEAYETIGFAAIHGHGISDDLIARLYSESEGFFALPAETKRKYARPEANNQRGFVSMGIEHAKDSEAADLKEFWQVGQPHPPTNRDPLHFPSNDEVAECPEDLDNDGLVNVNDVLLLLGEFGCAVGCTFDVNGINGVDVVDFLLLLGAYGQPCSN